MQYTSSVEHRKNPRLGNGMLPVDIVLHPSWWNHNVGMVFDRDFYFHPKKRVESEQRMEQELYNRWGRYGLGENRGEKRPEVGPVHLAAGFILSEMIGCEVEYHEDTPPQVIPAHKEDLDLSVETAFAGPVFKRYKELLDELKSSYGFLTGDINWGGVLNLALDLRGEAIFIDFFDRKEATQRLFETIGEIITRFTEYVQEQTGTSSISVNRNLRNIDKKIFLHSQCSHTMISEEDYRAFLFPIDADWSRRFTPYGIHYCGEDPHRFAEVYSELPHLDFLDVGWGGDVSVLREHLPNTLLNIRLSPVELIEMEVSEIERTVTELVRQSGHPYLTGVCCINIDNQVEDEKITAIFETVQRLRREYSGEV